MRKINLILRNATLYATSIVLVGAIPMATFAEEPPETYTYDAGNGRWNSNKWVYDPATKVYVPAVPEGATKPKPADKPAEADDKKDTTKVTAKDGSAATVEQDVNDKSATNINGSTTVKNGIDSDSTTGNAGVKSNSKAGDALSGNADADTTIINSVHTTVDGETEGVAKFTTNIYGDVVGDIYIGPSIDNAQVDRNITMNSKTNVDNNDAITNDVKVRSTSGDAEVAQNTEAGSATSGNANAVANVLNLVNTIIGANKSFVGTVNIYGNLDGDILVSPEFIPQLLADNSIERFQVDMPLSLQANNDSSIVNNVTLNAASGDASVKDNTGAGSATTGSANTKLNVLNLTGRKVDAKNSLLVFVNVLGEWVGMIVDSPNATAAAIGSGVNSNTTVNASDETTVNNKTRITNNLDIGAQSGDASVTQNTAAGNATSGDATASANIANIESSEFKLTDWFGILTINVFGKWHGSFGVDTLAGTIVPLASPVEQSSSNSAPAMRLGFRPAAQPQASAASVTSQEDGPNAETLAAANAYLASAPHAVNSPQPHAGAGRIDPFSTMIMAGGFLTAGLSSAWMGIRRRIEARRAAEDSRESGLSFPHN